MKYVKLFGEQFKEVKKNPNITRSSALLLPMHSAIAEQVEQFGLETKSLKNKEYTYNGPYGNKKLDIGIFKNSKLIAAIMFKGIRNEYNKNSNNYFENMRGESQLLIDGNIPVYQIILIPTQIKHKKANGEIVFETPTRDSIKNYSNYINSKYKPSKLKVGVYYIDVDYKNYTAQYSSTTIPTVEKTLTEGINNFIKEVDKNG